MVSFFMSASQSPVNRQFVERYHQRWKEYPSYAAEAAYTGLYLFKGAVEKANQAGGGWPDDEAIAKSLEGLAMVAPSGNVRVRPVTDFVPSGATKR